MTAGFPWTVESDQVYHVHPHGLYILHPTATLGPDVFCLDLPWDQWGAFILERIFLCSCHVCIAISKLTQEMRVLR